MFHLKLSDQIQTKETEFGTNISRAGFHNPFSPKIVHAQYVSNKYVRTVKSRLWFTYEST